MNVEEVERKIRPIEVRKIPLSQISGVDRFREDIGNLDSLKRSIDQNGLIHNLAVNKNNEGYVLLAGERRLRAVTELGWKEVTANIYSEDISEINKRAIELYENLERKDFTYNEEVGLKKKLHDLMTEMYGKKEGGGKSWSGWSLRDTSKLLNESPATVSQDIKLAEAIEVIPALGMKKNKKDAVKLLSQLEEKIVLEEIKKRIETSGTSDKVKDKIISSFIIKDVFEGLKSLEDRKSVV